MRIIIPSVLIGLFFLTELTSSLDNGLGRTPPMGWNTYNHFGGEINQTLIVQTVDVIKKLGLDKLGY